MKGEAMRDGVITEADTCREFVTPRLVEAGWGAAPHSIGEQRSFTNGRIIVAGGKVRRGKQKPADSRPHRNSPCHMVRSGRYHRFRKLDLAERASFRNTYFYGCTNRYAFALFCFGTRP